MTRSGAVATLTLNRPDVHNAFNTDLIAALHAACTDLARDAVLRVLVLQGAGPSFCTGADINWMRESLDYSHAENLADAGKLDAMLEALDTLPMAVVGRVHGAALGGGVGLLACCDIVIAAEGTRFGFTEVRLGLLPAVIARYIIPRIGAGHARALFVSGQRFDTTRAQAIGLVHEVVQADDLDATVQRVVNELLRCGPQAVSAAKALVSSVTTLPTEEARRYVIEAIAVARTGLEGQEGLRAFLEKREPGWSS
jgi:methylglutaconyl-CoA hydratase